MKAKEGETAQKGVVAVMGILFLLCFALAGLNYRFGWASVPPWGVAAALVFMVVGYVIYSAVMLQNAYASRVVEVQAGQTVITTGLYTVVRHPLYLGSLLLFLAMPFVLGSYLAALPMLGYPAILALRIKNEEAVLASGLPGYADYMKKTKYRLVPFIW